MRTRDRLTIFDLPTLDPNEARALANATISAHPLLARLYDDAFLANLIRRRGAYDNVLLLRLVLPEDEMNAIYWDEVTDDLLALEAEGSFKTFRAALRKHDGPSMESVRTELFFAAWVKRHGMRVALEPAVGNSKCEFKTLGSPETWWEIKTPLDLPELQGEAAVLADVQRRLTTIDQPYVLNLRAFELALPQVSAAVKAIKRQMYAHYRAGGHIPQLFASDGLVVSADTTTRRPKGYLGTMLSKPQRFQNENSVHVLKRVLEAADEQIPAAGGGVVVIDRSSADWIHHEDVVDACFGELQGMVRGGELVDVRLPGAFDDRSIARVSAVVSYTRRWRRDCEATMTLLHNPNALVALPSGFLQFDGVRHTRRVVDGEGFRFVTTPECADD